jgi:hypothetical protein
MNHLAFLGGRVIPGFVLVSMFILPLGCTSHKPVAAEELPPAFSDTEGAISGKLVNGDGNPFDTGLGKDSTDRQSLRIDLISPDHAVVSSAATPPSGKPQFRFEHVKPGTYELSVYRVVPGQRTIAGSEPVTVDANQITPVTLTLQVTNPGDPTPTK